MLLSAAIIPEKESPGTPGASDPLSSLSKEDVGTKPESSEVASSHENPSGLTTNQVKEKASKFWVTLRVLFLDLPLFIVFTLQLTSVLVHMVNRDFLAPHIELMHWDNERAMSEATYYVRTCEPSQITTTDAEDLLLPKDVAPDVAMEHVMKHGIGIIPEVLNPSTADALREWVMEKNRNKVPCFDLMEKENRYSIAVHANDDPSVSQTLREIATHPVLRPAIEKIVGKNPSITELSTFTTSYGAVGQDWHADMNPIGTNYVRSLTPSFSLFLPLQDTTAAMGATGACPGTHVCEDNDDICDELGIPASGNGTWHKGDALIYDMHMKHRGPPHTDEHGLERVLFYVTFTAKPRWNEREVESRIISLGGTFSIWWRQRGITLDDFQDTPKTLREPWRSLRAVGLYKPSNAEWGWDIITIWMMRLANQAANDETRDFDELLERGGFEALPSVIKKRITDESGWVPYLLDVTLQCKIVSQLLGFLAVLLYFGVMVLAFVIQKRRGNEQRPNLLYAVLRIAFMYLGLVLCFEAFIKHFTNTSWAKSISNGMAYTHPPLPDTTNIEVAPGTLANAADVLDDSLYQSEYLSSFRYLLDITHEGNRDLKAIVEQNSAGYVDLLPAMKHQLSSNIVDWVGETGGRFLTQNEENNYAEIPRSQAEGWVHNKLMRRDVPVVGMILTELSFLVSEAEYGVYRDSDIYYRHMPALLRAFQVKIAGTIEGPTQSPPLTTSASETLPTFNVTSFMERVPMLKRSVVHRTRLPTLPPRPTIGPPPSGTWIEEEDEVEFRFSENRYEWYKGVVDSVESHFGRYDVVHDYDDSLAENLSRECVRPYMPYQVGELIGVRMEEDGDYLCGRVTTAYADDTYDIDTHSFGMLKYVLPEDIQRFNNVGEEIETAIHGRGYTRYEGRVVDVRENGSFTMKYDETDLGMEKSMSIKAHFPSDGEESWRDGNVTEVYEDGSFEVAYFNAENSEGFC